MPSDFYQTSDTSLASYLITEGFALLSIDYSNPRFEFIFRYSIEIRDCASRYVSGNALTDPATYSRVNKKLLRIIRGQKQWEED